MLQGYLHPNHTVDLANAVKERNGVGDDRHILRCHVERPAPVSQLFIIPGLAGRLKRHIKKLPVFFIQ